MSLLQANEAAAAERQFAATSNAERARAGVALGSVRAAEERLQECMQAEGQALEAAIAAVLEVQDLRATLQVGGAGRGSG